MKIVRYRYEASLDTRDTKYFLTGTPYGAVQAYLNRQASRRSRWARGLVPGGLTRPQPVAESDPGLIRPKEHWILDLARRANRAE
jgi:hypothetical protein